MTAEQSTHPKPHWEKVMGSPAPNFSSLFGRRKPIYICREMMTIHSRYYSLSTALTVLWRLLFRTQRMQDESQTCDF